MENSVLVLGRMFPPGSEEEIVSHSRGMVSSAASAHLEKIIKGLDSAFGAEQVRVLNAPPISSYPRRYDRLFIKKRVYAHAGGQAKDISIDFFNLTVVKNISIQNKVNKYALEWARNEKAGKKYVVVYTMNEIFLKTCRKIKRVCPECHICVIVPDLPEYTDLDKTGFLYRMIIRRRVKKTNALSEIADSFVFLTEQMADYFPVKRPYIVSEAIAPEGNVPKGKTGQNDVLTAAYTGSFTKKYGIIELLDAIDKVKTKNVRFVICGSGEAYDEVRKRAERDSRIDFRGMVTHSEALKIQQSADILINPRSNDGEYTKYSFPSKIMEYMASAKPVICFKLDGIPDEYDNYLTYFTSTDSMPRQLDEILSLGRDELEKTGAAAAEFVRREKSCAKFGESIRALMEKKRLLICSDDLCIGGTSTSLLSLLNELDSDRYSVDLAMPNGTGVLLDKVPSYVNILPPALEQSRIKRGIIYLLRGYLFRRFIYRKTRLKKYPKGQFQLMSGAASCAAARREKRYYDAAVGYMEGFADNYAMKNARAGKKLLYVHVNYEGSGLDPRLDRQLFSAADGIAAVSRDCADALRRLFPECADKVSIIENPVSPELIQKLSENDITEKDFAPRSSFNIVTAARLENAHKAIDRAVMTMARLKKMTAVPIKWYVFGEGSDREGIEQLVRENGLEDSFLLMGARSNVYPYIKRADLFVLSSRYEGKPMCVTEAQILGCVPVVTEYGSAREQIQSGVDGIVCANSDDGELAEAICGVINDPRGLYEMRRNLSKRDYSSGLDEFYTFVGN